ncbi:hypothetical protein ACROYT_G021767 [Oculina patagonica]
MSQNFHHRKKNVRAMTVTKTKTALGHMSKATFHMKKMATRFPEIGPTDLVEMRENNQNKNTQKSTNNWVKVFDLWRTERSELRKLEDIPEDELDDVLCQFYAKIRKKSGEEYEPDSLAVMQGSLDRHLKNSGRNYSVLGD